MKAKRLVPLVLVVSMMFSVTGCRDKIFKEKDVPETSKEYSVENLKVDDYYIKDGTKFYKLYKPDGNFTKYSKTADASRILLTVGQEEEDLIPTLYKNEIIIYKNDGKVPSDYIFERYKDLGYTIGIRNLKQDEGSSYLKFNTSEDVNQQADAGSVINKVKDKYSELEIAVMDDKALNENQITASGTIKNLHKNRSYQFGMYAGSVYSETKIKADTHVFQSSETFVVNETKDTTKGYVEICLPEGLKTGYYMVNGIGLFRYVSDLKVDAGDLAEYEYNVANDAFELTSQVLDDTIMEVNKEQTINVEEDYVSAKLSFSITNDMMLEKAVLVTLDGKQLEFAKREDSETTYELNLEDVPKGEYKIIFTGKNIDGMEAKIEYGAKKAEVTEQEQQAQQQEQQAEESEFSTTDGGSLNLTDDETSDGISVLQ